MGNFNWIRCKSSLIERCARKYGEFGFLDVVRKNILQNRGFCLSPLDAVLHCIRKEAKVTDDILRVSVGLEDIEDITNNFDEGLMEG